MADQSKPFRCVECRAPNGAMVHHVRANIRCYVPVNSVSYDARVHFPAVKVELDDAGRCGPCGAAAKNPARKASAS